MTMRIACGGFMHETNTFVPEPTGWASFNQAGAWPGFTRGDTIPAKFAPFNIAITGFMDVAIAAGHAIVPLSWSFAQPSGRVADSVFERASAYLLADIADAAPDAVFLELHGAMTTETTEDAEGELLHRVRRLVGPDVPIVASLDLHANVTQLMVDNASFLSAYRTYPHIDWLQTGQRVGRWFDTVRAWGPKPARAFRQMPFLIPIASGCSMIEPMKGLYALLEDIEAETGVHLSLCPGFPSADIYDMGATVIGYGATQPEVDAAVDRLAKAVIRSEAAFLEHLAKPRDEALDTAFSRAASAARPVIIADTQDNPGAGGSSITTGFLKSLIARKAEKTLAALFHEPEIATAAHKAGVGKTIDVTFAAHGSGPGEEPLSASAEVVAVSDGRFTGTGPMVGGQPIHMGPSAWLRIGGIDVVVGTVRQQPHCIAVCTHLGVDITGYKVVVLKSSVHFRGDWQPYADSVVVGASPGAALDDTGVIPFEHLRPNVRRRPMSNA
ncbi:M81 family metallopeptidase [Phreatobacter stygius]|uniref:Microcystinase C n=1 Tax=Phreatobacter stygius TaxID=1940610 RepID=A0A4D7B445_9HYPH|nr:M81 family metallopeptidase [Phreatobacter stygius]QCI64436.1 M81 family metallopeptidase [Phreatobacter stygius]